VRAGPVRVLSRRHRLALRRAGVVTARRNRVLPGRRELTVLRLAVLRLAVDLAVRGLLAGELARLLRVWLAWIGLLAGVLRAALAVVAGLAVDLSLLRVAGVVRARLAVAGGGAARRERSGLARMRLAVAAGLTRVALRAGALAGTARLPVVAALTRMAVGARRTGRQRLAVGTELGMRPTGRGRLAGRERAGRHRAVRRRGLAALLLGGVLTVGGLALGGHLRPRRRRRASPGWDVRPVPVAGALDGHATPRQDRSPGWRRKRVSHRPP
jgi:hypothetical protein